jgi:DNA/RNA endonuclease YhcR with UshA esterase domain
MRGLITAGVLVLFASLAVADDKSGEKALKPISVEEAAKRIGEKVTVELEIKSTDKSAWSGVYFLNSEPNYRSEKNFTIFINKKGVASLAEAKIDAPEKHFKGKTVQITGEVKLYRGQAGNRP